ncbi:DnaJ subfamily C member 28 [Chionoecetes opilio]|uniref:DnaJ subfamily C member 28 n=1 Tax=Chionoecetes opilio TaxID=41210 RepID=A0A8J5CHN7_CHIOP|nr:DnaJ subfamily C member 28 [Chionoecetes opilio]
MNMECLRVLGLGEDSDQAAVRERFLTLAKKLHPDSGHPEASAEQFQVVERAYRSVLNKFSEERRDRQHCEGEYGLYYRPDRAQEQYEEEEEEDTIKHTAPQHRQYLSYEGIGMGTPSQRQKQYSSYQAMRASSNVNEYRVKKISSQHPETALQRKEIAAARKIRTRHGIDRMVIVPRYGIDRMVDDMIQEAMAKGEFDNLSMAGKPLQERPVNPYVDTVTHRMNEVLINNGYAPEWVLLEKEIREAREDLRQSLKTARERLGLLPLTPEEEKRWSDSHEILQPKITAMNKKIDLYNLLVPLLKQQVTHFPLHLEAKRVLAEGRSSSSSREEDHPQPSPEKERQGMFSSAWSIFRVGSCSCLPTATAGHCTIAALAPVSDKCGELGLKILAERERTQARFSVTRALRRTYPLEPRNPCCGSSTCMRAGLQAPRPARWWTTASVLVATRYVRHPTRGPPKPGRGPWGPWWGRRAGPASASC